MTGRRAMFLSAIAFAMVGTAHGEKIDVPDDALILRLGESMTVQFSMMGDQLMYPRAVDSTTDANPVVIFELTESGQAVTLTVNHGYGKFFRFRAVARVRGRKRQFEMPVRPVPPGTQRSWTMSEPFHELALFEFTLSNAQ